jgi:hypothetical protein
MGSLPLPSGPWRPVAQPPLCFAASFPASGGARRSWYGYQHGDFRRETPRVHQSSKGGRSVTGTISE